MSISPKSDSYPIHGAALASGVPYADGLAYVWAFNSARASEVASRISSTCGIAAWATFHALILNAHQRGAVVIRRKGV